MTIRVYGTPAPQGSKRHVGGGRMIESSKKLKPWRDAVILAARKEMNGKPPMEGPVMVTLDFVLERPKSVKRALPSGPPDLDKLIRSTFDSMTMAGIWKDDSQVVDVWATKKYFFDSNEQGALITVRSAKP
jgi:crossover junction endodeoxyribonuclease RusA